MQIPLATSKALEIPMKAELVPENGDPPIPITKDLVVVGRRGYCDVVIDHPSLSKRHCVLVRTDGLLVIRDLISTNGTKVKGQRIRWAALLPDDRITLGSYRLRVYLGSDHQPGPSELLQARARGGAAPGRVARPVVPESRAELGFPAPSPLEIDVSASDQDIATAHGGRNPRPERLIPLIEDDSEEIIELD